MAYYTFKISPSAQAIVNDMNVVSDRLHVVNAYETVDSKQLAYLATSINKAIPQKALIMKCNIDDDGYRTQIFFMYNGDYSYAGYLHEMCAV